MDIPTLKKNLRRELKRRRLEIAPNLRAGKSRKIIETLQKTDDYLNAKSIFCYISLADEVDTSALIEQCIARDIKLAVPKIIDKTKMVAVKLACQDKLISGAMGISTSSSNKIATGSFDIAITPGLGFTDKGDRLGYGRGYYDRWFSENVVKTKIALAFDNQLLKNLPIEAADKPMDIIVTEKRTIGLKPRQGC